MLPIRKNMSPTLSNHTPQPVLEASSGILSITNWFFRMSAFIQNATLRSKLLPASIVVST